MSSLFLRLKREAELRAAAIDVDLEDLERVIEKRARRIGAFWTSSLVILRSADQRS